MDEFEHENHSRVWEIVAFYACLVGSVVLGIGFYTVRAYFPLLGWLAMIIVVLLMCLVLANALTFTVRHITAHKYRDIGQFGTMSQGTLGRAQVHAPLSIEGPKERVTKIEVVIPTVAELLKEGILGTADLLLGYSVEGSPVWGLWDSVRTFCIAGKGRSGKTVTMFFLIIQVIMNGGTVYICDPHYRKKSSITSLLKPLAQHIRFAGTDEEIMNLTDEFIDTMEGRVQENSPDETPQLYVVDEFTRIVNGDYGERVFEAVIACAQQYAGFGGFAMIAGHEWTGKGQALAKLRRALHAKFVHRLDPEYAKYLLNSSKWAKVAPGLKTGYNIFQDSEGDFHELRTPLGTIEDALTIANSLLALPGPGMIPELAPVTVSPQGQNLRLIEQPRVRREEAVRPRENEVRAREDDVRLTYHSEDEEAVFHAYAELLNEGKETITKTDLMMRLHEIDIRWNNKRWQVLKDICEKYNIA
jgi:hypothetical protein